MTSNNEPNDTTATSAASDGFVVSLIPMVATLMQKQATPRRRIVARFYQSMDLEVSLEGVAICLNARNSKIYHLKPRQAVGLYLALTSLGVGALVDAIDQLTMDRLASSLDHPDFTQERFTGSDLAAVCGYSAIYRACDEVTIGISADECFIETTPSKVGDTRYGGLLKLPTSSIVDLYAGITSAASAAIFAALDCTLQTESENDYQKERVADKERLAAHQNTANHPSAA